MKVKCDFSGYATRNNIRCADGRTIRRDAFKDQDGEEVPLVWQHLHNDPSNVLGHAILENRPDGVYAYCTFNGNKKAQEAKEAVKNRDIVSMSIFANELQQNGGDVIHGSIREVSLVISGANPKALIENVCIAHSDDDYTEIEDEAVIYSGDYLEHADSDDDEELDMDSNETVADVFNTLTEKQKTAVYAIVGALVDNEENADDDEEDDTAQHSDIEGGEFDNMKNNVFDQNSGTKPKATLSHSQIKEILDDAVKCGSLKESFLSHAATYGIESIDILFPDAKTVTPTPDMIKRDTDWVSTFLNGTKHSPFSRIKSTAADITADEARAKGYVKGNLKKEEIIKLLKRVTTPTTVYKKQKLDRDDIIDITDLNVVSFLKSEMRLMLNEEIARAALLGDGREADSEDKINEENIRPIWKDDDMYAHHVKVTADTTPEKLIETILRSRKVYKGSGSPILYTTSDKLLDMLLLKDTTGRRLYNTESELAAALMVSRIVEVEVMEGAKRTDGGKTYELQGIIVNPKDYTFGADKGGEISMFDDFDIDYNQYKYLIETRCSGTLTHPKSALVIEKETTASA